MAHIYASFSTAEQAEKAAGALLDHGLRTEDITVVAHDSYHAVRQSTGTNFSDAARGTGNTLAGTGDRLAGAVTGTLGATALSAGYANAATERGAGSTATTSEADTDGVDNAAKHGISTTTPEDAGEGAVKGTGIGLAVGAVAALASLLVPGVGLVLGGGALATALGGTALAAGAGAIAGGATGYLKDQGVPSDVAENYHSTVEGGGALLTVNVPSADTSEADVQSVIAKYGGANVNSY